MTQPTYIELQKKHLKLQEDHIELQLKHVELLQAMAKLDTILKGERKQ